MSRRTDDRHTELPDSKRNVSTRRDAAPESAPGLSIGQILRMLLKHKWFIVGCTVLCALIAFIYIKAVTPIYEATATIRIDPSRAGSLGLNDLISGNGGEQPDILHTEIEVLQSDQVAIAALDSLPDDVFKRYADADKKTMFIPVDREVLTPEQEDLIGQFKSQLGVKAVPDTQLLDITFRDADPRLAATILNHVVDAYIRQNFDSRYGSVAQVTAWLSSQMQNLKKRAADAQQKLSNFEEQNSIISTIDSNTTTERIRLLNDRLAVAEADRILKEAQLQAATGSNVSPATLAALFPDPKLQSLQSSQGTLYAQYAQLSTKFGPNYAPLVQLKKQIQEIDAEINRDALLVRNRLKEEYDASKNTEDMLRREYADQTQKAYALNRKGAEFAVLQSEGTASRQLYNTLQYKLEQAGIDAGLNGVNTMPIDRARAPIYPVEPKKTIIMAFGTVLGFLIGIGVAFIVEASADKVMGLEQLGSATAYRPLVLIPHGSGAAGRASRSSEQARKPGTIAIEQPMSKGAESYRRLRNLLLQPGGGGAAPKSFMITSAQSGEGKSTVATNYALVLAQTGATVLLVDAEVRRPSLNEQFSVGNEAGLADSLETETPGPAFTHPIAALPNLSLLTTGRRLDLPAEALASNRFRALLETWHSQFDYIVIKAAPLLTVSDSLPMANWVDAVLIVVRQGVTRLKYLQSASAALQGTEANVTGIVINDARDISELYGDDEAYGKAAYAS